MKCVNKFWHINHWLSQKVSLNISITQEHMWRMAEWTWYLRVQKGYE